jgi:hypothetical protein
MEDLSLGCGHHSCKRRDSHRAHHKLTHCHPPVGFPIIHCVGKLKYIMQDFNGHKFNVTILRVDSRSLCRLRSTRHDNLLPTFFPFTDLGVLDFHFPAA